MNETITIALSLANAILTFLKNGGSHLEGGLLAEALITQANAAAIEAQRQAEFDAAVEAAVAAKKPAKG